MDVNHDRNYEVGVNRDQKNEDDHLCHHAALHEEHHDQTCEDDHHGHHAADANRGRNYEVDESRDLHEELHEEHHDQTCEDDHHGHHAADAIRGRNYEEDGRLPHENHHVVGANCRRDENRQSDVGLTLYRGGLSCLDVQT